MAEKPLSWLCVCLIWTGPVWGMSTKSAVDCPLQVRATVQEVREPASDSAMARQTVKLAVDENLKGDSPRELSVEILKHGSIEVEVGRQYHVQLNQGRLCWFEAI
jgi:hypothetical protein